MHSKRKRKYMASMKHFPTLLEYTAWVLKQPAEMVLGTAFDGIQYPYEMYLSEYYGTPVTVIAGDCYEINNRYYDLPAEWDGYTVGYHESDLRDAYETANGPQSGIEVTTAIETAYLREWFGMDLVPFQAYENVPCEVSEETTETIDLDAVAYQQALTARAVLMARANKGYHTGVQSLQSSIIIHDQGNGQYQIEWLYPYRGEQQRRLLCPTRPQGTFHAVEILLNHGYPLETPEVFAQVQRQMAE